MTAMQRKCGARQPCTTVLAIVQWIPFEPFTVCVTRKSAARLRSVWASSRQDSASRQQHDHESRSA